METITESVIKDIASEQEISLATIIAHLPGYVYWKDKNGVYRGGNILQARLAGFHSPEEVVGKTDYDLSWKENASELINNDQAIIHCGYQKIIEENLKFKDGREITVLTHKVPLRNRDNQIIGLLGVSLDITSRKEAEKSLVSALRAKQKAEQEVSTMRVYLENIIANLPAHVYWKDLKGVYLGCNDQQARMVGLSRGSDIVGKTDFDLIWREQAAQLYHTDQEIIRSGKAKTLTEEVQLVDGEFATFLTNKVPLYNENKQIMGILGVSVDITENKKAESALLEVKKVEIANQIKSEFVANVSHDLRTPLNGILGMLEVLRIQQHYAAQEEHFNTIEQASRDLLHLISRVLDFTKYEAGKIELKSEPFYLKQILDKVVYSYVYENNNENIDLHYICPPTVPLQLTGDQQCLERILMNLIGNALKFTVTGHVIISVECISISNNVAKLQFAVEDSGIGIPQDKLNLIFDRFNRLDAKGNKRYEGIGLGLNIVKQLVGAMEGDITVASQLNAGSTFIVTIPFRLSNINMTDELWQRHYAEIPVLVVDDNVLRGNILAKYFSTNHAKTARSAQAMQMIFESIENGYPYQIILVDDEITCSWIELVRNIDQNFNEQAISIMVLTDQPLTETQSNFITNNKNTHIIHKPKAVLDIAKTVTYIWQLWLSNFDDNNLLQTTSNLKILLIEDDLLTQRFMKIMLNSLECSVEIANNGNQALQMLRDVSYDLILVDIGLPDIDGIEVIMRLKNSDWKNSNIPVIAMSSKQTSDDESNCYSLGIYSYLKKPVSRNQVSKILVEACKLMKI